MFINVYMRYIIIFTNILCDNKDVTIFVRYIYLYEIKIYVLNVYMYHIRNTCN